MKRIPEIGGYALSLLLHVALFGALWRTATAAKAQEPVTIEIIETIKPSPAAALVEPPKPQLRVVHLASVAPRLKAPPPPNTAPPLNAPPPEQAPIRIGLSLSSTTTAGDFAAPVGNTLYGKAPEEAGDPNSARSYQADNYAPPTDVTTMPEAISTVVPPEEYPKEAVRTGFEGDVTLRLFISDSGKVERARIIKDAGNGLGDAAVRVALRYFRFRPAKRNGQTVATEIPFTVHFELP